MKKLYLAIGALALLAASCNATKPPTITTPPPQVQRNQGEVDEAIKELNASIDSEETINFESDDDLANSDKQVITDYEGVSNANY